MKPILTFLTAIFLMVSGLFNGPVDNHQPDENITTFIIVRHAEKANHSENPVLSEKGEERVNRLTDMFSRTNVHAVYSTIYIRTTETVRPLAEHVGLQIQNYDSLPTEATLDGWVERHSGQTVFISAHSNTAPEIANRLLKQAHFASDFDESDYGNLLIVTISGDQRKLLHLRY